MDVYNNGFESIAQVDINVSLTETLPSGQIAVESYERKLERRFLHNIGRFFDDVKIEVGTTVLHRPISKTDGRPIWEFDSFLEFFLAIRAALKGHKLLASQGVLHRDVNAGNILLSSDPNVPDSEKGFLAEFEFASLSYVIKKSIPVDLTQGEKIAKVTETKRIWYDSSPRGAILPGTVQFMAYELLHKMLTNEPVEYEICHDIESFIWVIHYAILRRIAFIKRPIQDAQVTEEVREMALVTFKSLFGHCNLPDLMGKRTLAPLWHKGIKSLPTVLSEMNIPIYNLIVALRVISDPKRPGVIGFIKPTHGDLLEILDDAIATCRQQSVG